MEDALVRIGFFLRLFAILVLILVVMEDALVHVCINVFNVWNHLVLILVVMEDALVPFVVASLASCQQVLILVVMEDALVHSSHFQMTPL